MRLIFYISFLIWISPVYLFAQQAEGASKEKLKKLLDISFQQRYSNIDSSLFYGFQTLELAQKEGYKDVEADALRSLSTTYQAKGDYKEALNYGFRALHLGRELNDSLKIAHSLNIIGMIYDQQGNFLGALNQYSKAYEIYKNLGQKQWNAMIAVNLGILFKGQGQYSKVVPYYREALQIYKELKMPEEVAFCETNLGSVFYYTHQYDSCIYYSLKAEKALYEQKLTQILPIAQENAGLGYIGLKQWAKAESILEKALKAHRSYSNKKEIAFTLIHLANVYGKLGQSNASYSALIEAKQVAEEIASSNEVMDASRSLAGYYASRKDYQRAYQEYMHYSDIRDTLFEKEKMRTIAGYQIQFETEQKDQQIKHLQQEAIIHQLQLDRRNLWLILSLVLLTASLSGAYLLIRQRKLKADAHLHQSLQKQQEIYTRAILDAEEQERRRIARDLHDGVGQALSVALLNLNSLKRNIENGKLAGKQTIDDAVQLVKDSYDEMRSVTHQMMPSTLLKLGLVSAVREFINRIDSNVIHVSLHISELDDSLDDQTETVLFRIIQESVNNVIKHARASSLSVQIFNETDSISVSIEDNGVGFDPSNMSGKWGIGLQNIQNRLAILKGSLEIDSAPGKGTLLLIYVPIVSKEG